jgi:hypothetical protein
VRSLLPILLALAFTTALALPLGAQPTPSTAGVDARKEEARLHFERGLAHFDRQQWQAAAVEFLASRALFVTKANTKDAAICLRKIGRYDEALSLFEALLNDFTDLPAGDRELAEREVATLLTWVGQLDIDGAPDGARVVVDGVERGTSPLPRPLRLTAGTHGLSLVRDGFLPLEVRVDVPGGKRTVVSGKLVPLTRAGRLRVVERDGRTLGVVIDGTAVGSTPWEGALAPGAHTVLLRGPVPLGTPPRSVVVVLDQLSSLELTAVRLPSALLVRTEPPGAEIEVDGVWVGSGTWQGRLSAGRHRVAVEAPGYEPVARAVVLAEGTQRDLSVALDSVWRERRGVSVALEASAPIGLSWGGTLEDTCRAPCSASVPLGGSVQLRVTYAFPSRLALGAHGGYLQLRRSFRDRAEWLDPVGLPSSAGRVRDELALGGLVVGGHAEYSRGERFRFAVRMQAGAFLGTLDDRRRGTFVDSTGASYAVDVEQRPRARYVYVGPEIAGGRRLAGQVDVMVGARLLAFAALGRAVWDPSPLLGAGEDGAGRLRAAELTGATLLLVMPTLSAGYTF